ncbi:interleukin-12 subunit alpha [Gasterosteus aculeatus]|uniref:Interleukin-12 subunit alpha n=1 Tax=Gasterosteus aculeatus aculeatus TaxID=481459 RepID=G3P753_GASAC
MTGSHFYFASCVLLLTLSWRTSSGLPLSARGAQECGDCALLLRELLQSIPKLLSSDVLFYGINLNRSDWLKMPVREDETTLACAPTLTQGSSCTMQRNSSFSESECLSNIGKDLAFYAAALKSYRKLQLRKQEEEVSLLSPTLEIIQCLWETCPLMQNGENYFSEEAARLWERNPFSDRLQMHKIMLGFYVRTITINRAMGYIASGDHRK